MLPGVNEEGPQTERLAECPECEFEDSPRKLAFHLERHREVTPAQHHHRTGKALTTPCPEKCGRHFLSPRDYREHVPLCDGSAPIVKGMRPEAEQLRKELGPHLNRLPPERTVREDEMEKCDVCGKECKSKAALGQHKYHAHKKKGKKPRGDARKPAPPPGRGPRLGRDTSNSAALGHQLREQAAAHRKKADRLESMAEEVESLV